MRFSVRVLFSYCCVAFLSRVFCPGIRRHPRAQSNRRPHRHRLPQSSRRGSLGAQVSAEQTPSSRLNHLHAASGNDGRFALLTLAPGRYRVRNFARFTSAPFDQEITIGSRRNA